MEQFFKSKIGGITISAMFVAIIAVVSQFSLLTPIGVPITFQVFGVAFCGYLFSPKQSLRVLIIYILIGVVGLPVFSGFKGGANVLFGATGGYIIGFVLLAVLCSFGDKREKRFAKALFGVCGIFACHIIGLGWLVVVSGMKFSLLLFLFEAIFIIKDIVLVAAALFVAKTIRKNLKAK